MRRHKPVSQLRWFHSQKQVLQSWQHKSLDAVRIKRKNELLPILERFTAAYDSDAAVLEIGCGPLCLAQHLPQQKKCFIDPLLDDFRRMYPGELPEGELLATTAERIDKPNNSFEVVVCINSLGYALNPELILNEIERLLTTDGKLILSMRLHTQLEARLHYLAERFLPFLTRRTRPYYYAQRGIRNTLARHFDIEQEISLYKGPGVPMFRRERRIFICAPLGSQTATDA